MKRMILGALATTVLCTQPMAHAGVQQAARVEQGGAEPADGPAPHAQAPARNRLILVVIDGVRWQEMFRGAEGRIVDDTRRTADAPRIRRAYLSSADPAAALTPFLHSVPARAGVMIGDRDHDSCMRVGNRYWFSYPGYNELLTGTTNSWANTNDAIPNPDISFLEWINGQPGHAGGVRAFATWNNFPNILNTGRSGIPVNRTDRPLPDGAAQGGDMHTHAMAMQSLRSEGPDILFVVYGETDDFAHHGQYAAYLDSLHRADGFIAELWNTAQAQPGWAGRTTLIVTTDHGRGRSDLDNENWRHHGSGYDASPLYRPEELEPGSDQTWAVYLGPRRAEPVVAPNPALWPCPTNSRLAATAIEAMGLDWRRFNPRMDAPMIRVQAQ